MSDKVDYLRGCRINGIALHEAAIHLGTTPGAIRSLCSEKGFRPPLRDPSGPTLIPHTFVMTTTAHFAFRKAANDRGITIFELLHRLGEVIADDKMFDAILDDGANDG